MNDSSSTTVWVRRVASIIFPDENNERIDLILASECGPVQVHAPDFDDGAMERIWLAALKMSGGSIAGLEKAAKLARRDWRDLLLGAGFGNDLTAHLRWATEITG